MRKRTFYKRAFIWLCRFRYRKGYGVHSPFAFRLITDIIYAKDSYYDFDPLKEWTEEQRKISNAVWRKNLEPFCIYELLYKLVDEVKATTILEVGVFNGVASVYLSMCRKSAKHIVLSNETEMSNQVQATIASSQCKNIDFRVGDLLSLTKDALSELQTVDFLLLRASNYSLDDAQVVFEYCLESSGANSLFVIQDIHTSEATKNWWKSIVDDRRVGITFDLYDMGLVFFDKTKIKQHYIVNF